MTQELQAIETGEVRSKILELQSALMFTESLSAVKLPTHVISEVEVDSLGSIWFVIPKPQQSIEAFDMEIPTKLDFFKKGTSAFVKVRGTATIIRDNAEIVNHPDLSDVMKERMMGERVIAIRMDVSEQELVDNNAKPAQTWFQASRSQLSSWFF